jgi:cytochrome c peroxidase
VPVPTRRLCAVSWLLIATAIVAARGAGEGVQGRQADSPLLGLPPIPSTLENPPTPSKIALGRRLFFDKRLSVDNTISCATCHDPTAGYADPHPVSVGVKGRQGERNSNTLLNVAFLTPLMWDGRAMTLEEQALLPFLSPAELDLSPARAVEKLRQQNYTPQFQEAFGEDVTIENLARALAAYQRTLISGDSPFDRFIFLEDQTAISPAARRGFDVFLQAKCDACHLIMTRGLHPFAARHVMFTDNEFHNLGVDAAKSHPDPGRYGITLKEEDWGRFRTPSLRNVALTAPYFHDGSAATLLDVVELYDKGGNPNRNLDPAMRPLQLTPEQKQDLVHFLESLNSREFKDPPRH